MRRFILATLIWAGLCIAPSYAQGSDSEDLVETILKVVSSDREFTSLPPGFLDATQGFEAMQDRLATSRKTGTEFPALSYNHPAYRSVEGYIIALSVPKSVKSKDFPMSTDISELVIDFGKTPNVAKRLKANFTALWGVPSSNRGDSLVWRRVNTQPEGVMRPLDQGDLVKVIVTQTPDGRTKLILDRREGRNSLQTLPRGRSFSETQSRSTPLQPSSSPPGSPLETGDF